MLLISSARTVLSNENMVEDLLVLSPGGDIILYILENGDIKGIRSLLEGKKWSSAYWPSYSKKNGAVFFEAENSDYGLSRQIFYTKALEKNQGPTKVIKGRRPSVSLNGRFLAYYIHPNELWVLDLELKTKMNLVRDMADFQPAVWISNSYILYTNSQIHLMKLDTVSGKAEDTGYNNIFPSALSPDGDRVLCVSDNGRQILLYTIDSNKMDSVKKTNLLSMGSSFVWSHNGKSFLYTRQTLSKVIKFNEMHSLFLYSLDGNEKRLADKFSLFGGFSIKQGAKGRLEHQ
jgi:Tol biopolymer transport system component